MINRRKLFSDLVLPNMDSAYRLARGLTGNRADADDVVQDACLRAFQALDSYSGGNARAWLMTITRNVAFTFLARRRSQGLVLAADQPDAERRMDLEPDPQATPEASVIAKADAAAMEAAIAQLPEVFREVLVLREFNGLSYREIADATGVPLGTVMSRLARARAELLKTLWPAKGTEP